MTQAHTPAPWGRNIKPARKYPVIYAGRNTHVAMVIGGGLSDDELEANCNLIAAAPDLLEACQIARIELLNQGLEGCAADNELAAAIARARGES